MHSSKKGFTLLEIMVIVVLIAIGLITVIGAMRNSNIFLGKMRQKIIAINLAREGMEIMMNIRDTNRQNRAGKKDACRLKVNPLSGNNSTFCENDTWLGTGNYILLSTGTSEGQKYFYASGIAASLDLSQGLDLGDQNYSLCELSGQRTACPGSYPTSNEGQYFRQIRGIGVFLKNSTTVGGTPIYCPMGSSSTCGDTSAKEYRYCSSVQYISQGWPAQVELCGVLTNFQE